MNVVEEGGNKPVYTNFFYKNSFYKNPLFYYFQKLLTVSLKVWVFHINIYGSKFHYNWRFI